jgi:ferric-dicitrate binding protein FerR (iron transport regulator)
VNTSNGGAVGSEGVKPRGRLCVARAIALALLALLASVGSDSRAASWGAEGFVPLVYHGRPLPEVIRDLQRYVHRRIRVDAAAAGFQYSGIVKLEDVEAWLRDLPTIYPLEVVDCHSTGPRREISACIDPQVLLIRSRTDLPQNGLRTARL